MAPFFCIPTSIPSAVARTLVPPFVSTFWPTAKVGVVAVAVVEKKTPVAAINTVTERAGIVFIVVLLSEPLAILWLTVNAALSMVVDRKERASSVNRMVIECVNLPRASGKPNGLVLHTFDLRIAGRATRP
jgi:hypothetical protein